MFDIFDDIFDLNDSGSIDAGERAMECEMIYELMDGSMLEF